jgi:Tol biopolymer transport system component/DNA-binding winged helix-turn-helix (wHTH) protein
MAGTFRIGDWRVDPPLRTLSGDEEDVHIEPKQMQVLLVLAERAGEVVSKDSLLKTVWPDTFVGDDVLSKAVSELRRVLKDDPKAPRFIQTIPKGGYRLVAPVRFDAQSLPDAAPAPATDSLPPVRDGRWRKRLTWGVVVVGVTVLAIVAATVFQAPRTETSASLRSVPFTSFRGMEIAPSFSPDGTHLAFQWNPGEDDASRIFVKRVGDDPPQQLTRGPGDDLTPSWSSDGRFIAFSRAANEHSGLFLVPALGGPERKLLSMRPEQCLSQPRWSPNARQLVFAVPSGTSCHVQVLSLDTFERRTVTSPAASVFDANPMFSPDGRTIAFVRYRSFGLGDLHLVPAGGGSPTRLTFDDTHFAGALAWTPNGTSIIFAADRGGSAGLWRVAVAGGRVERLPVGGESSGYPAIDATGRRLAYVQLHDVTLMDGTGEGSEIYELNLERPTAPPRRIASSSRWEHDPHFSPDGKRIAFSSARGSTMPDIWIADADGANPTRLTYFDRYPVGTPRWAPDGQWIAFDASARGNWDIFIVRAMGGTPTPLTSDPAADAIPSWSRDGRWIYFQSARTGSSQMWKMPAGGGPATQLTKDGAFGGFESADGMYLYYNKGDTVGGVWRVPVSGGLEEPILPDVPGYGYTRFWALVENGLYFLNSTNRRRPTVQFFSFSTRKTTDVAILPKPGTPWSSGMAISPDGRHLLVVLEEDSSGDIVLVENFH